MPTAHALKLTMPYDSLLFLDESIAVGGMPGDPVTDTVLRVALAWLATDPRGAP